jgi:hypothetical protein
MTTQIKPCTNADPAAMRRLSDAQLHALANSHSRMADEHQRAARAAQGWADAARKTLRRKGDSA